MSRYPRVIASQFLERLAEIQKDIEDAEAEILDLALKVNGYQLVAMGFGPDARMANFQVGVAQAGIERRRRLVDFLKRVQAARVDAEWKEMRMAKRKEAEDNGFVEE